MLARDATDSAIAKFGTPIVYVDELGERFPACPAGLSHATPWTACYFVRRQHCISDGSQRQNTTSAPLGDGLQVLRRACLHGTLVRRVPDESEDLSVPSAKARSSESIRCSYDLPDSSLI